MSEESSILIRMSQQIGELNGTVKAYADAQAKTNEALFDLIKDHDKRIKDIEGTKNKLIGATIFSAIGGSGIATAIMKLINGGS